MVATLPDLLRLVAIPVFGWAAWQDIKTRRLSSGSWAVLTGLGIVLLMWESIQLFPFNTPSAQAFFIRVAMSLVLIGLVGFAFGWFGLFGGADAKAMISISILLPVFPSYNISGMTFPLSGTPIDVFSITVMTNAALLAMVYPVGLAIVNIIRLRFDPVAMFLAIPMDIESLHKRYGWLSETLDGTTVRALDLDALRMYLRWRGLTIAGLRNSPEIARDPTSIDETYEPSDGRMNVDNDLNWEDGSMLDNHSGDNKSENIDDPWGAEQFLNSIDGSAYNTSPEQLREGLELLATTNRDTVWVSPGLPFVVAMFAGLFVAFTYGDLLFALLRWIGVFPIV
jgi:preflagellin peptidase FlaK